MSEIFQVVHLEANWDSKTISFKMEKVSKEGRKHKNANQCVF